MLYRLENPLFLWALLPVGFFALRMLWKKKHEPLGFAWRRFFLVQTALLFCIFGLSRPQAGTRSTNEISARSNLFIALDISQSMLATDITPSRMGFAINFAQKLLQKSANLRVALFPFTTDGYQMMPLSTDNFAAIDLLNSIHPSITTGQGSNLTTSLKSLYETIHKSELLTKEKGADWAPTAVLLLSDGESHHPLEDSVLQTFKKNKIPIHTVITGTPKAVPIPDDSRFGGQIGLRDPSSQTPILTKASPETMLQIARLTGGDFFEARFSEVERVTERLKRSLSLGKMESSFKLERDFYPVCFLVALLLLSAELLFGHWEYALRVIPLLFFLTSTQSYAEENALDAYDKYNEGVRQLKTNNLNKAIEAFVDSGYAAQDLTLKKKALYNLGNAFLEGGDPTQAIVAYQQARDVQTKDSSFDSETNQKISENMVLAFKQEQMQQQAQKNNPKEGEGDGDPKNPQDSKGPKQFQGEPLSEGEKKKLYEAVADEERQTLSRLRREQNRKTSDPSEKPW